MSWKDFEKNVYEYLVKNIQYPKIHIVHQGNSDSTVSDIHFYCGEKKIFTIECKENESQASQFVVKNNIKNKKFENSEKNKFTDEFSDQIINHMNDHYDHYSKVNENGNISNELLCSKKLMYSRVVSQIKSKALFIASSHNLNYFSENKPLLLVPVEEIENYFDISGIYRTKISGTRELPQKNYTYFEEKYKIRIIKNKIYLDDSNNQIDANKEEGFFFSKKNENGLREIRKKSTTSNANIIFSLSLRKNFKHTNFESVKSYIEDICL